MLGFLFGAACVAGVLHVMRRRRGWRYGGRSCGYHRGWGSHHGCGGHGCGGHGRGGHGWDDHGGYDREDFGGGQGWDGPGSGGGSRNPWWLRGLFLRLDTSPGQEKVIREVLGEMRDEGRVMREELRKARVDVATVLRSDSVDATAMGEAFGRHDDALDHMRKGLVGALAKLHEALDERQRGMLAQWLESGRMWHRPGRDRDRGDEAGVA